MQNQVSESNRKIQKQVTELARTNPLTAEYYIGITGLAKKLAARYNQEHNEEDFIQVALVTACKYENNGNYKQGISTFYTYCIQPITTAIQSEFGNPNANTKIYKIIAEAIKKHQNETGYYPDIDQIHEITKLSMFDIISVYYDKHRDVSLQSLGDDPDVSNVFVNTDNEWLKEHLEVLTPAEHTIIQDIYYLDRSLNVISESTGISVKKLEVLHQSALNKIKESIND